MGRVSSTHRGRIRVGIYPAITADGIGTYVNGIRDLVGADVISVHKGAFSLGAMLGAPRGYDVLHCPTTLVPLLTNGEKIVCTVQDVIPLSPMSGLSFAARAYFRFRIWWSLRNSHHLIFTSRSTLDDVRREFGSIGPHTVIPLAVDAPLEGEFIPPYPFPYCFSVGRRRRHKNTIAIVQAFSRVPRSLGLHLIFGGKQDINDELLRRIALELGVGDRVIFAGFLSPTKLAAHYTYASSLVFPSLLEGFGLPILEAMGYGCPVITSNQASMPEVAGGAALLVDPRNIDEIARSIVRVYKQPGLRQELIDRGRANAMRYSWAKVAAETSAVYELVFSERSF